MGKYISYNGSRAMARKELRRMSVEELLNAQKGYNSTGKNMVRYEIKRRTK